MKLRVELLEHLTDEDIMEAVVEFRLAFLRSLKAELEGGA